MYASSKKKAVAKPKRKADKTKEKGVFEETEGKIKEDGLRKSLKLKDDDKPLTMREINKMLKEEVGDKFKFRGKDIKMSKIMMKRLNLAKNMMKKK